jgi:hypothetical protein
MVRSVLDGAGCGVAAAALSDRSLAEWARAHGVTVIAHDADELDLLQYNAIRPTQVVFRCGRDAESLRRAASLGVLRFIVTSERHISRLTECAQRTRYVYLDDHSPLVFGSRSLRVIGLHGDVDHAGGSVAWATAAERLLCRTALLKTCGSPVHRIMLSGGSIGLWLDDRAPQLTSIVASVDDALRDGCARWRLPRPAVTLMPLHTTGSELLAA